MAVLSALPSFIKNLSKTVSETNISKLPTHQFCSIKINSGELLKGEAAILLADKYLIAYTQGSRNFTYNFNCDLLKKETMISLHSLNPTDVSILKIPFSFNLVTPEKDLEVRLVTNFGKDGVYEGSLFKIVP